MGFEPHVQVVQLRSPSAHTREALALVVVEARESAVLERLEAILERAQESVCRDGSSTVSGDNWRSPASSGSARKSERVCSSGLRPPRTSWNAWTMNSISRIPPGPSLMFSAMSLRATSFAISVFMCRSASNTP
jgi:hypothetical protein